MMCSRDGMEAHLHKSLLLQQSHLNPQRKSLKNEERGSERALLLLVGISGRSEQERMWVKGYGGYLYPLSQKTSCWWKGTRILRVYVRILRTLRSGDSGLREFYGRGTVTRRLLVYVRILRHLCLDIPNQDPDTPGLAGDFTRRLFIVVGLILMIFVGFFEHNYHVNTYRSKSLLIVRRSYTQFQNKI
jgi:hypothetical protein